MPERWPPPQRSPGQAAGGAAQPPLRPHVAIDLLPEVFIATPLLGGARFMLLLPSSSFYVSLAVSLDFADWDAHLERGEYLLEEDCGHYARDTVTMSLYHCLISFVLT